MMEKGRKKQTGPTHARAARRPGKERKIEPT